MYLYKPCDLEKRISKTYQQNGIIYPSQLDEGYIARKFDILLVDSKFGSFAEYCDDLKIVALHRDLDSLKRREVFFHEVGHLFLHVGDQSKMTDSFRSYQESQAKRFTLFAAIPYHMLTYIDFSKKRDFIIYEMQETFRVPAEICEKRLDYIESKVLSTKLEAACF